MAKQLRIAVADDEPRMLQFFEVALEQFGHQVVVKASTGRELVAGCQETQPDLIITDIKMPELDGLEAVKQVTADRIVPVNVVSAYHDSEYIEAALREHVLAYLVKPIKKDNLKPAVSLVMRRFLEFQTLQQQTQDLKQSLQDRKLIEQAKGVLMRRAGFTEEEAFRRLQQLSNQKLMKMAEIAEMILTADEGLS